jgi:type VI secretion system protein
MACALPGRSPRFTLRVDVAADANGHAPVPVDLVFVWDKSLAAQVQGLSASDWFGRKTQFRQDDPRGEALTICEWEWVPGQQVPDIHVMVPAAARSWLQGAYVFAHYRVDGAHRYQLPVDTATVLHLLESRIEHDPPQPHAGTAPDYVVLSGLPNCTPRSSSPP